MSTVGTTIEEGCMEKMRDGKNSPTTPLPLSVKNCKRHPKYKGTRWPTSGCPSCITVYMEVSKLKGKTVT